MKRVDNIFYKICSIENLRIAAAKAKQGKKRNRSMRKFDKDVEGHLQRLHDQLLADLHLTVKDNWQIFPVEVRGIDFLGFVFRHGYVLLRKRIKQRIFKALRRLRNSCLSIKARRMAVGSYIGWLKYTNSKHLIQTFNSFSYVSIF